MNDSELIDGEVERLIHAAVGGGDGAFRGKQNLKSLIVRGRYGLEGRLDFVSGEDRSTVDGDDECADILASDVADS